MGRPHALFSPFVIPAEAGIQTGAKSWTPAFAGVTKKSARYPTPAPLAGGEGKKA